jgi:hypothetical protein
LLHLFVIVLILVCSSLTKDVQVVRNENLIRTTYTYAKIMFVSMLILDGIRVVLSLF